MTVSTGVALAATIGGPAVGALAVVVSGLNSRGDRSNARNLARGSQWFETRREVYEELLRYMHHSKLRVDRTEPILTTVPAGPLPPDPVPTEEALQIQVRTSIFGSPDVNEAAEAFMSKVNGFFVYASARMNEKAQGTDAVDSTREMNGYRQQAGELLEQVVKLMRDELQQL